MCRCGSSCPAVGRSLSVEPPWSLHIHIVASCIRGGPLRLLRMGGGGASAPWEGSLHDITRLVVSLFPVDAPSGATASPFFWCMHICTSVCICMFNIISESRIYHQRRMGWLWRAMAKRMHPFAFCSHFGPAAFAAQLSPTTRSDTIREMVDLGGSSSGADMAGGWRLRRGPASGEA